MTFGRFVQGVIGLIALLFAMGLLGGVGGAEFLGWLIVLAAWVIWWAFSRRHTERR